MLHQCVSYDMVEERRAGDHELVGAGRDLVLHHPLSNRRVLEWGFPGLGQE